MTAFSFTRDVREMTEKKTSIDNGGPAFSRTANAIDKAIICQEYDEGAPGMSLRDYMAGQALSVAILKVSIIEYEPETYKAIAEYCYRQADAMIKEREKDYSD